MSVYRRKSGRWAVRVDVDRDASGRRRRRALGTFATRKEAERAEREALFTKDRGVDLSPRHVTVAELLSRYLRDRASRCGAKTLQEYERIGNRYVLPRLGAMLLAKVRPAHIAEWQAAISESGGRNDSAISPKTVYHARALLYGALRWAVKMQLLAANPCAAVDPPTIRRSEAKALRSDEIARLLDAAAPTRWGPFVALAFALGAPRGELLALRWSNIDLERRTVTIEASLSQTRSGVSRKGTKTDRVRTVPLSPLALDAIRRQRALQAQDKLVAGAAYADQGFVFADALGSHISPMAATNAYARLARKAGISSTRLHDTRHTAATMLLVSGVDARTTAGILGHASPIVTMSTYAHLLDEAQREGVERLGAAIERCTQRNRRQP